MPGSLRLLDRVTIAYILLPLPIFFWGWFRPWMALLLIALSAFGITPLFEPHQQNSTPGRGITSLQLGIAVLVGCAWTYFGGTGHFVFANADWHTRDAVLHDLVSAQWPVSYGKAGGQYLLLRAPLGYYMPAALLGKIFGLSVAHLCMAAWTAIGASLFMLQVLSLAPSRATVAALVAIVIVLFSGMDVVGELLDSWPHYLRYSRIATHIEWWAGTYQYSSMTTQLFWVPNHCLAAWLTTGLLFREPRGMALARALPTILVATVLWSPLSALGLIPFVLYVAIARTADGHIRKLLDPRVWLPALVVGLVLSAYMTIDLRHLPFGSPLANGNAVMQLLKQAQFFLLEAGFVGFAILALKRSRQVMLALVVLAILPIVQFGPGNDLVMRASIPSIAILAITAAMALIEQTQTRAVLRKKAVLAVILAVGAVTPIHEFARAILLPAWPINLHATVVGTDCGQYPPNYVGRLGGQPIARLMKTPSVIAPGPSGPESCDNPAILLMWRYGLLL